MSRFGADDISETLEGFLVGTAKTVMYLGALATVVSVGLLVLNFAQLGGSGASSGQISDGMRNIDVFQKVLTAGVIGLAVGSGFLFWGEELLGAAQLLLAAALFFAPLYVPSIFGGTSNLATDKALAALQIGGAILGAIGLLVVVVDIGIRVSQRVKTGAKADHIKYGKGIKEEGQKKNVFLGKCWQLPFCRKFVRDRCPIYHSGRTCWKELVGCMCEEQVIRNAMENKTIPKDALLAANFIPRNHKLSYDQKRARCFSCVIYNEHQQHKYKAGMYLTILGWGAAWGLGHGVLFDAVRGILLSINKVINHATLGIGGNYSPPNSFVEVMLAFIMVIGLTYAMKLLEFAIFKLKV